MENISNSHKSLIHGVVQFRIIKAGIKLIRQSRTAPTNNRYSAVDVIVAGLQDSISLLFVRGLGHRICWNQYSQAQPQLNFNIHFQLNLYLRFLLPPIKEGRQNDKGPLHGITDQYCRNPNSNTTQP